MNLELKEKDRICFLGDSITSHGLWIAEIFEYFINHYPQLHIEFYNCGISGSKGCEANLKNRLYCDCLDLFPRYLVIMFGMNDIMPHLYNPACPEKDKVQKREEALSKYEDTLEKIITICKKRGITPILCTPTPYDEYNDLPGENWYADSGIKICYKTVISIAKKHNILLIDMQEIMRRYIHKLPVGNDRIHPNEYGQHLMAECFLHTIGAKENIKPDEKCELSEKNKKRFETEQIYRQIMFVERDTMLWQYEPSHTLAYRKRLVKKRMENENADWEAGKNYLKNADYKDEIRGELIKLTSEIYD